METKPANNRSFVELHVPDFEVVKSFYGKLGFLIVWERKPEKEKGYLVMQLENNILCFWPGNEFAYSQPYFKSFSKDTKRGYGVEIVIMVSDIDSIYSRATGIANITEGLIKQPWGIRDFRIEDPNGYYLRFSEPYDTLLNDYAVS